MNNKLVRISLFSPPGSHSAILPGDRAVNALGGIGEWPRRSDCFAGAHPFLKYARNHITQVQTSCLRLVRWGLRPRRVALGESRALGGRCAFIVFGGLFGITEGI